jgi:RNA-directed DNA polymerase
MAKGGSEISKEGAAMTEATGANVPVAWPDSDEAVLRVQRMQTKLHHWAAADRGRRFDDLFNLVYDPATLRMAFERVAGNAGANTAGVDRATVRDIRSRVGVEAFLDGIRVRVKARDYAPLPVRERMIPKTGGKLRRLGIPTIADRVVQAALKLVLEPIFESGFSPASYGFRPYRRAHDAIAEIHHFGTLGYRWVLDADIEACFDRIDHTALMGRVRQRIKDKRVLALVKAFLKAGIMTELGQIEDTDTGTPQGGILSPLLANIALSVLDDHFEHQWAQWSQWQRKERRRKGLGTWRHVRYADDFVVLVNGTRANVEHIRDEITAVLEPMGLRLSESKTQIVHMREGFDFLGFRIVWKRKRGTDKWYVYTFIADKPVRALKAKIRALTRRLSHADYKATLIRINQIQRGWGNYFRHAVAKHTLDHLREFVWWRIVRWVMKRQSMGWTEVKRRLRGPNGWRTITLEGIALFNIASIPVTRYRWRGGNIPPPGWHTTSTQRHDLVESRMR